MPASRRKTKPAASGLRRKTRPAATGLRRETRRYDFVVAGGGMAGYGAALTAARHGLRVALVQDRPVLGGNASKEIRVWLQGASGGANVLWFRETGLMEELLLENQRRNPEVNPEIWDTVLVEKALAEKRLTLFMNSPVFEVHRAGARIRGLTALTLNSERLTTFEAPFFADCTGDGTVAFLAGAPFMQGREARSDYAESLAPRKRRRDTLGATIYFFAKDLGRPVEFHAPAFAHKFTEKDLREGRHPQQEFDRLHHGFWWAEWGGILDTIHDNEAIKWECLRIAWGLFDFLKNDPAHREQNRNFALEWIGALPGKRESRRLVGDHVLTQGDIVAQAGFPDAVAYGGWNLDDHAPKGFFDDQYPPSTHTQIPGLYNIPLRCLYSKTVPNLFFAGRNASTTHVAFTSTRVMLTGAQMGEAIGAAAALCVEKELTPRELAGSPAVKQLQQRLLRDDHYFWGARGDDPANRAGRGATARASSQLPGAALEEPTEVCPLDKDRVVLFPAAAGRLSYLEALLSVREAGTLEWELHRPDGRGGVIPAGSLATGRVPVAAGAAQWVRIPLDVECPEADWRMLELKKNPAVSWHATRERLVGLAGFVERAPDGPRHRNVHSRFGKLYGPCYCVRLPADPRIYGPENVLNGFPRPFKQPNLWVSAPSDFAKPEWLEVAWRKAAPVREVIFLFDSGLDRHIHSVGIEAPYRIEPDLVRDYDVELRVKGTWQTAGQVRGNYLRRRAHRLERPVAADAVRLVVRATNGTPRAQVFEVRVY